MMGYAARLLPYVINYKLARLGIARPRHPAFLNHSITNKCQSKCKTCNIWQLYKKNPAKEKEELTTEEIEKVFKTMQPIFAYNICGGEPFLREDIGDICRLAVKYIKPAVIHSPTNCLAPEKIEAGVKDILSKIPEDVKLTIKMSLDGIGKEHDKIRGVKGNFKKLMETHDKLVKIRKSHPNLYVDAGTTVSNLNLDKLPEINAYVKKHMKLDNFYHEIADMRAELFNIKDKTENSDFKDVVEDLSVTPTGDAYSRIAGYLCSEVIKEMKGKRSLSRILQASRIVYYKRAAKVMRNGKRVLPCYAGISNAHINPWGDVWVCNVQAFRHDMGNLKNFNYNFDKLWNSKKAKEVRKWVNERHCYCPLVGQGMLDTIMSPSELAKVFWYYVKYR